MSLDESTDALVDVAASAPLTVAPGRHALLRFGVVQRLVVAQSLLPRSVRFVVVAGHDLRDATHLTGGAVDLTLFSVDGGLPAQLPCCHGDPVAPAAPRRLQSLIGALGAAGLVNDPRRWWHWSYGDSPWADTTGAAHARYGPVPRL
ncbi:D-alanyl-D-alanine dipeptidase [Actinoplanes cyaneus]|uniref:D-alanyl-D-alanine dipeptidase n=1 Tax=Actinoplanes cyaneus TaxID=52696 RepID=A0A919IHE8_9ACTN|nr:hypothetical protein [Actinoplanes cyaneus]MCW2140223.1 hypothetical protein [Actinoplanes cyaneus]GID65538.1 D-alanyl-D-alanine dipeptidase [Actinoplanes cyaneus]